MDNDIIPRGEGTGCYRFFVFSFFVLGFILIMLGAAGEKDGFTGGVISLILGFLLILPRIINKFKNGF